MYLAAFEFVKIMILKKNLLVVHHYKEKLHKMGTGKKILGKARPIDIVI